MRTWSSLAPLVALTLGLALVAPVEAGAAQPCGRVDTSEGGARVATVRMGCVPGREVASTYYDRILEKEGWDGIDSHRGIYYLIGGFRCFTGLAGNQMFCRSGARRIFASTLPEDHPASWRLR